jgi:hypothetical protein
VGGELEYERGIYRLDLMRKWGKRLASGVLGFLSIRDHIVIAEISGIGMYLSKSFHD